LPILDNGLRKIPALQDGQRSRTPLSDAVVLTFDEEVAANVGWKKAELETSVK